MGFKKGNKMVDKRTLYAMTGTAFAVGIFAGMIIAMIVL